MQDDDMLLLAQGAKTRVVTCPEQSFIHLRCWLVKKLCLTIYVTANSYHMYFGEISQIPLTEYLKQHTQNIQWKKSIIFPIFSISSSFFRKKLEEIAILQFLPGVPEEIHFFRKKNNPAGRGQFWSLPLWVLSLPVCVCPLVQAKITKFGVHVQKTLVKVPVVLGVWSTLNFKVKFNLKSKFVPFWACPHDNFSSVQVSSPNLDQKCILVQITIDFGLDKPSASISRVGFLPEEMYFFQDAQKKLKNSYMYFSSFFWKKMEEMEGIIYIAVLVVHYGISNTIVLEIP